MKDTSPRLQRRSFARYGAFGAASALTVAALIPTTAFAAEQTAQDLQQGLTAENLVEHLVGTGIEYSNVVYTGSPEAAGIVSGMEAISLSSGVALSSGRVSTKGIYESSILGPNTAISNSNAMYAEGDADLDAVVSPYETRDAAVLEFDFVPDSSVLTFTYVFGSDEYNEWVGDMWNDVFGFFVNGENCAIVESGDPVSVNSINNEVNSHLYIDNDQEDASPYNTALDGFTVPLTCVAEVNQGETNHVKLAIADTQDSVWDSSVIISAGTFRANQAPVADSAEYTTPVNTPVEIALTGSDPDGDDITYELVNSTITGEVTGEVPNLVFTPEEGFTGTETFTFLVNDGTLKSAEAVITIHVSDDSGETDEGETDGTDGTDGETDGTDEGETDGSTDAGDTDGSTDAGDTDAGDTDAGSDEGQTDAGDTDGSTDAGNDDAGDVDAGDTDGSADVTDGDNTAGEETGATDGQSTDAGSDSDALANTGASSTLLIAGALGAVLLIGGSVVLVGRRISSIQ